MIRVYLNYPNHHVYIHAESSCSKIQQQRKVDQRVVQLNDESLSRELKRFKDEEYQFGSSKEINDMWLEIDMGNLSFEKAIVEYIVALLAQHYSRFKNTAIKEHC